MKLWKGRPWSWDDLVSFFASSTVRFWLLLFFTYLLGYIQGRLA